MCCTTIQDRNDSLTSTYRRHIHVSLRDSNGKSLFAVSDSELKTGREGAANDDVKFLSQEGEWFLAGVLDGLPDSKSHSQRTFFVQIANDAPRQSCLLYAASISSYVHILTRFSLQLVPTINGYKRLVGGEAFWAPNAVTYGYDSRAASIRIISPPSVPPAATRLEVRVPGADMNPYFALSAVFSLGMRGIEKKLKLPGPPIGQLTVEDKKSGKVRVSVRWNICWSSCERCCLLQVQMLPQSLESATERMMRPESIAREESVLGSDFVDHFGGTRQHEVKLWNEAVTNWEGTHTSLPFK